MAFFKFRQRSPSQGEPASRADEPAADPRETIDGLRRRARHRLLGALVLVLAAVIGFPLLFDTQPRPVVVDAPIIIPDRDRAPPLRPLTAERPSAPTPTPTPAPGGSRVSASASLSAGEELVPDAAPPASAAAPATRPAAPVASPPKPAASAPPRRDAETADQTARARRQAEAEARARRQADAARAQALLEGKKPAPPAPAAAASPASNGAAAGRFVVQIGAFADAGKVRQVRQQAERAGLKTYVQDVTTKDGKRTRVRLGPYASRAEAERAAAALQKAGLTGAVLSL